MGLPWGGNGMVRKGYRGGDGSGADGGDDGGDDGACNAKSAYPAPMIRPVRIAALALLPVLPIALIAGCSHSKPSDDPSATAEATDSSGTPDPTSVPSVATPASPSPAATESEPAATEDSNESNESEDQGGDELPAQGLDQAAALDDGLAVQIGALRATDLEIAHPTRFPPRSHPEMPSSWSTDSLSPLTNAAPSVSSSTLAPARVRPSSRGRLRRPDGVPTAF